MQANWRDTDETCTLVIDAGGTVRMERREGGLGSKYRGWKEEEILARFIE